MGKILSTVAILLFLWAVNFGYNTIVGEPFDEEWSDTDWIAEQDAWVGDEIADGSAAPARGWLAHEGHATFEADPQFLDSLIDEFHAEGGAQVWMVGIESFQGHQLSDSIAVELPSDPDARARLFAIEAKVFDGEGTPDVGQRFLTVSLD